MTVCISMFSLQLLSQCGSTFFNCHSSSVSEIRFACCGDDKLTRSKSVVFFFFGFPALSLGITIPHFAYVTPFCISRLSDQNGVSLLCIMLEIHHSGREPWNYVTVSKSSHRGSHIPSSWRSLQSTLCLLDIVGCSGHQYFYFSRWGSLICALRQFIMCC